MKLNGLHHLNIRCSASDLAPIEGFYTDVVGLQRGYRPDFKNEGIWLYDGGHPLVHVSMRCPEGFLAGDKHNGSVDHIAFRAADASSFIAHLEQLGVPFQQQNVPEAGYQIFLRDPVGTLLEFNFPNEEAPATVALGALAARDAVGS